MAGSLVSKLSNLYASDLQTFLGGRTILREVEEEEMCVTALLEEKCLQQVNVCYRPEAKQAAINNIEIFGSVCRETSPPVMFRMLIWWLSPLEIANLVSSIQDTSKAYLMAGSLVSKLSDVQSSFTLLVKQ
jgi:hypothetical protein